MRTATGNLDCTACGYAHPFSADQVCGGQTVTIDCSRCDGSGFTGQDFAFGRCPTCQGSGKIEMPSVEPIIVVPDTDITPGYHLYKIKRGDYGEPSKIMEESTEFMDAIEQESAVMALVEASDLLGAVEGWLDKYHPSMTLDDLRTFSAITKRAFKNGHRSPK